MPTPALRRDFVDERQPLPNELPAAEYNLNAQRTDAALDLATAAQQTADGAGAYTDQKAEQAVTVANQHTDEREVVLRQDVTAGITNGDAASRQYTDTRELAVRNDTIVSLGGKADLVHTHTSAQITDFTEAVQDAVAALLAQGANVSLTYDDAGNKLTIAASGGGTGTSDPEAIRDTIGAALIGLGNISVLVDDAGDTITIVTTATVNATDAALRDRSTHSGSQLASTISDFAAAADARVAAAPHAATSKTTPVDADELALLDSAASFALKRFTWASLKAAVKTYYDTVVSTVTNKNLTSATNTFPTFNQSTTGNAATATKLATARNINGVPFDGSADVTIPGGTGGGSVTPFHADVGTGSPGPYLLTHNLGVRDFVPVVTRNGGHADNIGLTYPSEQIDVQVVSTGPNTAMVIPDATWSVNQFHIALWPVTGGDNTAPGVPVITEGLITSNSIVANVTDTDNVGITFWEWDLNGTFVARTPVGTPTYQYSVPNPSTTYTLGCTAVDLRGNRTRGTRQSTSGASIAVAFDAATLAATVGNSNQAAGSASISITIGNGVQRLLLAVVTVGGTGGAVDANTGFTTLTVTSTKGTDGTNAAALTKLASVANNSGKGGSTHLFALLNPAPGTTAENLVVNTGSVWSASNRIATASYANVAQINIKTTRDLGAAAAVMSLAAATAVGNMLVLGAGGAADMTTGFTGGTLRSAGGNGTQPGSWVLMADAQGQGAGTPVTFANTQNTNHGGIIAELVKA